MAKKQDFLSKTMKHSKHTTCPVCGNPITHLRVVNTERKEKNNSWRFSESHTGVCKCNENKIYS